MELAEEEGKVLKRKVTELEVSKSKPEWEIVVNFKQ